MLADGERALNALMHKFTMSKVVRIRFSNVPLKQKIRRTNSLSHNLCNRTHCCHVDLGVDKSVCTGRKELST